MPPTPERQVHGQRAGGDDLDLPERARIAQAHNAPVAVGLGNGGNGGVEIPLARRGHLGGFRRFHIGRSRLLNRFFSSLGRHIRIGALWNLNYRCRAYWAITLDSSTATFSPLAWVPRPPTSVFPTPGPHYLSGPVIAKSYLLAFAVSRPAPSPAGEIMGSRFARGTSALWLHPACGHSHTRPPGVQPGSKGCPPAGARQPGGLITSSNDPGWLPRLC